MYTVESIFIIGVIGAFVIGLIAGNSRKKVKKNGGNFFGWTHVDDMDEKK